MTVGEMRERMGHDEYVAWGVYHSRKAQRDELASKRGAAKRAHGRGTGRTGGTA